MRYFFTKMVEKVSAAINGSTVDLPNGLITRFFCKKIYLSVVRISKKRKT